MFDAYVQQWSAIQTVRAAGLHVEDVFVAYFGLAGKRMSSTSRDTYPVW